jgi:hypothetical protein
MSSATRTRTHRAPDVRLWADCTVRAGRAQLSLAPSGRGSSRAACVAPCHAEFLRLSVETSPMTHSTRLGRSPQDAAQPDWVVPLGTSVEISSMRRIRRRDEWPRTQRHGVARPLCATNTHSRLSFSHPKDDKEIAYIVETAQTIDGSLYLASVSIMVSRCPRLDRLRPSRTLTWSGRVKPPGRPESGSRMAA